LQPIQQRLLAWYLEGRRQLPWRGDPPPWCVDKAALRRAAAAEVEAKQQPKISSFLFKRRLASDGLQVIAIDLTEDGVAAAEGDVEVAHTDGDVEGGGASASVPFARSAYGTWVSEVMLQQTQVERVVEYWTKWMKLFPTVQALAQAHPDDVNAAWAGLGYYGRARRLHEGAKFVVEKHGGEVPGTVEELLKVPGIGPYTAGAISSIAFGQRSALVDGNVIRVFARLMALPGDAASQALARSCWVLAEELVDTGRPGDFNQALMELGATVCTPKAPACDRCPTRAFCRATVAVASGKAAAVTDFPAKAVRKPPKLVLVAAAVVEDAAGRVLLARRAARGLLAGQWEFPSVILSEGGAAEDAEAIDPAAAAASLAKLLQDLAPAMPPGTPPPLAAGLELAGCSPVEHTFSHQRHNMFLFRTCIGTAAVPPAAPEPQQPPQEGSPPAWAWMTAAEAEVAGVTSGVHRIFRALGLQRGAGADAGDGALSALAAPGRAAAPKRRKSAGATSASAKGRR